MKSKSKTRGLGHYSGRRAPIRPSKWAIFEQMKAALPPELLPEQHAEACKRIARELGI